MVSNTNIVAFDIPELVGSIFIRFAKYILRTITNYSILH